MVDVQSEIDCPIHRLRLCVPREDGALFALPPLNKAVQIAQQNHAALQNAVVDIQGRRLADLRQWARGEVFRAAHQFTSTWTDLVLDDAPLQLMYAAGHQPSLFHPGVWVKNFALSWLANQPHAVGINLVVDNDTFTSSSIRVPSGDREHPSLDWIALDSPRPAQPWEGARILDRPAFEKFGNRITKAMSRWDVDPLIDQLWPLAIEHSRSTDALAECLTAARNQLERRWGATNLELPLSHLCRLDPFLWFASHIFAQLPRFRSVYNQALDEYRLVNKIRSQTHPVPKLHELGDWLEAPFWVWHTEGHERARVFARREGHEIALRNGRSVFARLPLAPDGEACCAVDVLRKLPEKGIHLRTRALTTTLFSRLCFADLFLHGIGGATYDEMTDRILARFYGIVPPEFMTISATVLLPLRAHAVKPVDFTRLNGLLRDLHYNPQQHLQQHGDSATAELLEERTRLIQQSAAERNVPQTRRIRRQGRWKRHARFTRLRAINEQLWPHVETQRQRAVGERDIVSRRLEANSILQDRESSFVLYPAELLKSFMKSLSSS